MASQRVSCGLDYTSATDINQCIDSGCKAGYDFICLPLVHPRFRREFIDGPAKSRPGAFTRSDMLLSSQDWGSLIVGKVSPWLQVDSLNETVRKNSERAFRQELMFASHLSVPAIMIPLTGQDCSNLARILNQHILSGHNHQFWIHVPMKSDQDQCDDVIEYGDGEGEVNLTVWTQNTWHWWNALRTLCDHSKKIGVALEVTADLPPPEVLEQWFGEPIKTAILSTSIFMVNKKGYPVLSKAHQAIVRRLYKLDVQIVIKDKNRHRHTEKGMRQYQQYLDHLWQKVVEERDELEMFHWDLYRVLRPGLFNSTYMTKSVSTTEPTDQVATFAKGYEDYLQCPLQPLKDNLESQTYEVFEKDPIKYSQYQKAVYYALLDRVPPADKDTLVTVVMVLGAGRGPLVTASLQAAQKADRLVKVYAVEKNPNAVVTLENMKYEQWGEKVTVVSSDMRVWQAPEKADIIVSELLGSFGDNELSPECLDGAQKFLKDDGISIPKEYTSYIGPLSSSKLWNEARLCKEAAKPVEAPFETPYVVRLHNVNLLAEAQPLFTFTHPSKGIIDNNRYEVKQFTIPSDTVLHGFAGYFDCLLYGDVTLSIVPQTHSPGMFSWFPIFIPIKEPMALNAGDEVVVNFWRLCTERSVWYEWAVTEPRPTGLHNPNGRSYTIDL